ncbi:MAG: hypothetical protein WBG40_03580, partial [Candidatus Sulfotelmatobacter sp.]
MLIGSLYNRSLLDENRAETAPVRSHLVEGFPARAVCAMLFLVLMSPLWCSAADLVLIRSAGSSSLEQQELELATRFYGLDLKVISAGTDNVASILGAVHQNATLAVVIEAKALAFVNQQVMLQVLNRRRGGRVPLLILGVTPETDSTLLSSWSGGAVVGVEHLTSPGRLTYVVGSVANVTDHLAGLEIPFPGDDTFYFATAEHSGAREILAIRSDLQVVPVFIEANLRQQKVFLLSEKHLPADGSVDRSADSTVKTFAEIVPVMMFTKYCAGDRGWHALQHYANLTIDDPWLREPYGHLNYQALLKEMEKHDFHTTIAFIPWNYDRSEAEAVELFRNHPERFSVCVHGDNHDHKEFDDLKSKPLGLQIAALKQSLARMEKFQTLTGIPYDNVFVFPHNIGSESILEELKTYNFIGTVNSLNVPIDRPRPSDPLFALRPVTLSFGDFPSISRYSATMPSPSNFIGINEFLDNPLFLYSHQDFFARGADAFDGVADEVNKLEPDIRWSSVGDIVKHLYLVRLRDDSNYDVLAFSSSVQLTNTFRRDLVFYIQKQESGSPDVASVSVDGRQLPFQLRGGYLELSLPIPAGKARNVVICYKNDLDLASISTSKDSLRVYVLRELSDFRDITLSEYSLGRTLIDCYYKHELSPLMVIGFGCVLIVLVVCGAWSLRIIMKRKNFIGGP